MSRPDVLRIDDVLLRAASVAALVVAAAFALAAALPAELLPARPALALGLAAAALAPVALGAAGLRLRRRDQRAVALLHLVERHVELDARDLLASSDFTAATLDRAVRDLNSSGVRHVVWDRGEGRVLDGRLRHSRIHVDACAACGAKIALEIALTDAVSARCPACDTPLDARAIDDERHALIADLAARPAAERARTADAAVRAFSPTVFALLLVACWPLAVAYAAWHWHAAA
ncbi:MAG: hypothetical protein R3E88_13920 [Myxococcota bacterium]